MTSSWFVIHTGIHLFWPQTRDGLLSPTQRNAKVIYELLSQYYWLYTELLIVMKSARGDRETYRYRVECGLGLTDKKVE